MATNIETLNLNSAGVFNIEYPINNTKVFRLTAIDDNSEPILLESEYEFSISEDANFQDIFKTYSSGDGLTVSENIIELSVNIGFLDTDIGLKFWELKDILSNTTLLCGKLNIINMLVK